MKKIVLAIIAFLINCAVARAGLPEWNYTPSSSFTATADSGGNIVFSSVPIRWLGVTIASPAVNSYLAIYRSTTDVFTADLTTQALISADYLPWNQAPTFFPLFDVDSDCFTYINKVGTAKLIYWVRCGDGDNGQVCPGLRRLR